MKSITALSLAALSLLAAPAALAQSRSQAIAIGSCHAAIRFFPEDREWHDARCNALLMTTRDDYTGFSFIVDQHSVTYLLRSAGLRSSGTPVEAVVVHGRDGDSNTLYPAEANIRANNCRVSPSKVIVCSALLRSGSSLVGVTNAAQITR